MNLPERDKENAYQYPERIFYQYSGKGGRRQVMEVTNRRVAEQLVLMGELLEILGESPFKIRAYRRAADVIDRMSIPVSEKSVDELLEIGGIGSAIARKVREIVDTGSFGELEETRAKVPAPLIELLKLEGVGPKTVKTLWNKLNIQSIEDLEKAASSRRIRALKGFGEKKEQAFLKAIAHMHEQTGRMNRLEADSVVRLVSGVLKEGTFEVAGSYRRGKSTIGDIDIVCTDHPSLVNPRLRTVADEMIDEGDRRTSIRCRGTRVDIRFTTPKMYGSMLLYLTGSKAFNIKLREIAVSRGNKLNEYGIEDRNLGKMHEFSHEEDIFAFLGMDFVPPELREDWGEVEAALSHSLPEPVKLSQIRGDCHVHSNWSDGSMTLAEIAGAGEEIGYEYIVCSDHSATLGIAHGLDGNRLKQQEHEIEILNRTSACQLVHGVEVDILADGSLGLPHSVLSGIDVVIASVHSAFTQDIDRMTRRVLAAVESEHVDIIGHPTGRILGRRPPFEIDMARIIVRAEETGTALECNASPYRLDLDDTHIRESISRGVKIALGTDAHEQTELLYMKYGAGVCRRGWATPGDILNTRTLSEFMEWLK